MKKPLLARYFLASVLLLLVLVSLYVLSESRRLQSELLPLPDTLPLHVSHVESVLELPSGAVRLAATALDVNHAFRVGGSIWGIQFHPEFDADVMRRYLEGRREILKSEGFDPDALQAAVRETPLGDAILARFGRIAAAR